jgi:hypothetical protein
MLEDYVIIADTIGIIAGIYFIYSSTIQGAQNKKDARCIHLSNGSYSKLDVFMGHIRTYKKRPRDSWYQYFWIYS